MRAIERSHQTVVSVYIAELSILLVSVYPTDLPYSTGLNNSRPDTITDSISIRPVPCMTPWKRPKDFQYQAGLQCLALQCLALQCLALLKSTLFAIHVCLCIISKLSGTLADSTLVLSYIASLAANKANPLLCTTWLPGTNGN